MTLQINLDNFNCRPGQEISVCVAWDCESTPSEIVLELLWQTSGKGTEDSETVFTESFTPSSKNGDKTIQIALPRGPISVRGNLISIDWQLTCTSVLPSETCIMPMVLSHLDQPVCLTSVR